MGIAKDIRQDQFRNDYQKAMINLMFTHGWTLEQIKKMLSSDGITPQQFNILRILRGSYPSPLSTMQIRERMLDKMSDTSRIVDRLLAKELVKKIVCKNDRRLVDITITEKGKKLLGKIDARQEKFDGIFKNLSVKEAAKLSDLLDKIRS